MKKALILFLTFILFSCNAVLKASYGIKKPKIENFASINAYLEKQKINSSNILVFKDLKSFTKASKMNILTIPDALFFDENGNSVSYKKSASDCNAKISSFIEDLYNFSENKEVDSKNVNEFLSLIKSTSNLEIHQEKHINVYITWATYVGKLNKEKAFEWIKLLEEAKVKGININYYLLNCDFQEEWQITDEQKTLLGL